MDQLIAVGRIGLPRGVRGDVFVEPFTDDPDDRFAVGTVLRTDPVDAGPLTVEYLNLSGSRMVLRFAGYADRNAVEALRGVRLVIASGERPPIEDPDEFYASELVGLAARTVDGAALGRVADVIDIAGADYLVLDVGDVGDAGDVVAAPNAQAERLIPFVAAIVPTVDVAGGFVVIDPPEGLLEL